MEEAPSNQREPAPGDLAIVQAFINTNDREEGREEIPDPEALRLWLTAHGLLDETSTVTDVSHARAIELREALRALTRANIGVNLTPDVAETLNRIGGELPLLVRFNADAQTHLEPSAGGVEGALARLLAIVHTSMVDGTWHRLKACANDRCQWAFFDHSKNRSGTWCTMAACGDKVKARAYRARRKGVTAHRSRV